MAFNDGDLSEMTPFHTNGSVAVAATPVTITAPSSNIIQQIFVQNPSKGVNANAISDILYISIDQGSTFLALARGESISLAGDTANIKIKSSVNGVKYEVILWY